MNMKNICILTIMLCLIMANTSIAQKECTQKGDQPACAYQALNAGGFKPKIDGNLDDWKYVKGVFLGADFWEVNGEQYSGENDLSLTWWVTWDTNNLYVAFSVKDDKHQNTKAGDAIWNGDGAQLSIDPTGKKSVYAATVYEYGYALAGGEPTVWRWATNAATKGENSEYMIVRDESKKLTNYEIKIPSGDIAPVSLVAGKTIGWGFVMNESDSCDCQGGWIGWGSRSIVFGKDAPSLADLVFSATNVAVSPQVAITTSWGELKK
jgi:hypothetical protein